MSNLLDKASVILTPTAYNNGEALCVKPSDGSGDFDFSRNSAATRVNAQGLVENVQILSSNLVQNGDFSEEGVQEVSNGSFSQEGSEEITNGDFSNGLTSWNGSGYTVVNNQLITNSSGLFYQVLSLTANKTYKAEINIESISQGGVKFYCQGNQSEIITTSGVHTIYIVSGSSNGLVGFNPEGTFEAVVNSISFREVGQDWVISGSGWSIGEDKIVSVNGSNYGVYQLNALVSGKTYKITYEVKDYVSGQFGIRANTQGGITASANGVYTDYLTSNGDVVYLIGYGTFNGSVTNISFKEVGQNWTLGTGWEIGNSVAISDTTASNLTPSTTLISGEKYKFTLDVAKISAGSFTFLLRFNGTNTTFATINTEGSFTFYATADATGFRLQNLSGGTTDFSVTNITAVQITDDTNLPRISYENFSYQDALGSELVQNGRFDTDSDWTKASGWSISGGVANANTTAYRTLSQNIPITLGKKYKVVFDVVSITSGSVSMTLGANSGILRNSVGTYSEIIEYNNFFSSSGVRSGAQGFVGSIDNVSVKEYLGQEVVPNSGCGSWLFEPQSTNLITQSEALSTMQTQSTITDNVLKSPTGNINASIVVENTALNSHAIQRANIIPTNPSATSYTLSIFAKKKERQYIQLGFFTDGVFQGSSGFDLENGTTSGDANTHKIKDFGNGWYRCSFTKDVVQSGGYNFARVAMGVGISSYYYTGDGVSGLYMFGFQVEQQSYATSYIPTNGEANGVTRNQDLCTNGGSLATINSTEGTLYFEGAALANENSQRWIALSDGTHNNSIKLGILNSTTVYKIAFNVRVGGVNQAYLAYDFGAVQPTFKKCAVKYKQNDFALWIDGVEVATDTSGNVPLGLSELNFTRGDAGQPFYGKTKALAVWKEALSDQELADLTYPTPTDPTFSLDFDTIAEQFTFARGSEATYVDAQGLIKSTNELGAELITNGDFATDSNWSKQAGWTISGGTANANMVLGGNGNIYQTVLVVGKTYELTLTVSNYVQGYVRNLTQASPIPLYNSNGTFTEIFVATATNLFLNADTGESTQLSIDNVSVKEVISATNTPRLDYSTGAEAFLLEPQSTNLITYSNDWSFANFNNSSVLLNTDISPDGTQNADTITFNGAFSAVRKNYTYTAGTTYTISFYAKKLVGNGIFQMYDNSNSQTISSFNITDEWARYSGTFTPSNTSTLVHWLQQGVSGIYQTILLWGAQVEALSYPTSLIPSNGSQTTRNQETCINATPEINSEEGVLYAEIAALSDDGTFKFISLNTNASNRLRLGYSSTTNKISVLIQVDGAVKFNNSQIGNINQVDFNKIAVSYSASGFKVFVNGVEVNSNTVNSSFALLNKLDFRDGDTLNPFFGNTKDLQYYTKALSDAELINLTTI